MDILNLDEPLKTAEPVVQLSTELKAGTYVVALQITDAAGQRASAEITVRLVDRIRIPPITPITPITPVTPITPIRRPTG